MVSSRRSESSIELDQIEDADLQDVLDGLFVRGQQLIHFALAAGVVGYLVVLVGLSLVAPTDGSQVDDSSIPRLLSYVHPVLFLALWFGGNLVHAARTRPSQLTRRREGSYGRSDAEIVLANVAEADLLRAAMLEAVALFGLTTCLLAHLGGELQAEPLYWFHATSAVLMVAFTAARFPSKTRYLEVLEAARRDLRGAR